MIYELMSDGAVAQIESNGAELCSLKDIFGTEYIWQGDASYWGRRSPVLFPIIGRQKDNRFEYGGKTYPISRHGFARDCEFDVIAQEKNRVLFSLSSSDHTLQIYPFRFSLQVSFSLENTVLTVEYRVLNIGEVEMLFQIGGHTGYNCPLAENETFGEYLIEFEQEETFARELIDKDGFFTGEKSPFLKDSRSFHLDHALFDLDAIIPDHLKSKSVSLINQKTGRGVQVRYDDFDNLAIWSALGKAPFVCLEPWNGCASGIHDDNSLVSKRGVIRLAPGGRYSVSHSVSLL